MDMLYIIIGAVVGIVVSYHVIKAAVWSALRSHAKETK